MKVFLTESGDNAALEARSIAGDLVPFRAPHHSIGQLVQMSEEFHLAAGGVLYLDEAWEFKRQMVSHLAFLMGQRFPAKPLAIVVDSGSVIPYSDDDHASKMKRARAVAQELADAIGQDGFWTRGR